MKELDQQPESKYEYNSLIDITNKYIYYCESLLKLEISDVPKDIEKEFPKYENLWPIWEYSRN